jgi:hypothetical protein
LTEHFNSLMKDRSGPLIRSWRSASGRRSNVLPCTQSSLSNYWLAYIKGQGVVALKRKNSRGDSMNPEHKKWVMQWKSAAVALQQVRDLELKAFDSDGIVSGPEDPLRNGLVIFQRWMMRKAILDAYATGRTQRIG